MKHTKNDDLNNDNGTNNDNYTKTAFTKLSIFSKPTNPTTELETQLSNKDTDHLNERVQVFHGHFAPCRIVYSSNNRTTESHAINSADDGQVVAMGKLACELNLSKEFNAAYKAASEAKDIEPINAFEEQLMKEFCERWLENHNEAYLAKIRDQGLQNALESRDVKRMVVIISEAQKPMFLAFCNRVNELMDNPLPDKAIASLLEQFMDIARYAIQEEVEQSLVSQPSSTAGQSRLNCS